MAHWRYFAAHWSEPLPAPGAAQACPTCLRSPANQLTPQGDSRPHRPIERAARFALVPSQLGGFTSERPAIFPFRTLAMDALIGGLPRRFAGGSTSRPASLRSSPPISAIPPTYLASPAHSFRPRLPQSPGSGRNDSAPSPLADLFSFPPMPNPAGNPLICGIREVWPRLRPLAQAAFTDPANQLTCFDFLMTARPFLPSSLSSKPRLRAERTGGLTSFDLSSGVLGNEFRASSIHPSRQTGLPIFAVVFPVPDDREHKHFPRGKVRGGPLSLIFPPFLRGSGPLRRDSAFSQKQHNRKHKTYATPPKTRNHPF